MAFAHTKGLIIIDEYNAYRTFFRSCVYTQIVIQQLRFWSQEVLLLIYQNKVLKASLAGRVGNIELTPFYSDEVGYSETLWFRGRFPRSHLASSDENSRLWLKQYITTFLEKDIEAMGFKVSTEYMRKLWTMTAQYHGNLVNFSELGRSLNTSDTTVRNYLGILEHYYRLLFCSCH